MQGQSFGGPLELLKGLRQRLTWVRSERVRREGKDYFKLAGVCEGGLTGRDWLEELPRCCRLYLDAQTLWPHRVEWWGAEAPRSGGVLLFQAEFRDPVINQPLWPEQCQREFTCPAAGG
jgi:hypothetical protein